MVYASAHFVLTATQAVAGVASSYLCLLAFADGKGQFTNLATHRYKQKPAILGGSVRLIDISNGQTFAWFKKNTHPLEVFFP